MRNIALYQSPKEITWTFLQILKKLIRESAITIIATCKYILYVSRFDYLTRLSWHFGSFGNRDVTGLIT